MGLLRRLHNTRFRRAGANGFFPSSTRGSAPRAKAVHCQRRRGVCCTKFPVEFTARPAFQVWFNCKQRQPCHEVFFPGGRVAQFVAHARRYCCSAANQASYAHSTKTCSFIASLFVSCPACLLGRMREHVSDQQTGPCLLSRCEQIHPAQLRGRGIDSTPPARHT
jgi:hypothetical protein